MYNMYFESTRSGSNCNFAYNNFELRLLTIYIYLKCINISFKNWLLELIENNPLNLATRVIIRSTDNIYINIKVIFWDFCSFANSIKKNEDLHFHEPVLPKRVVLCRTQMFHLLKRQTQFSKMINSNQIYLNTLELNV